jgi:thiol-disulfide isomerase/thioredoxin
MKTTHIANIDEYKKAIQNKSCIIFSTTWCPDCFFLKTFIDEVIDEHKEFTFYDIDRDELLDFCIELGITGIPSLITYDKGEETGRFVSKERKTKQEVEDFLNGIK